MADRKTTPDILGSVLGPVVDESAIIRQQLRYDYSLIPAEQRTQVQAAAVDIVQAGRQAQESLIVVGQKLLDVKGMLEHGQFEDWCKTEFQMTPRTVQNMMNVARTFGGKSEKFSLLSDSTLYMLAAPSTPEAARIEVLERAEATGQKPSVSEVKETINRHKPQPTPVKVTRIDDAAEDAWRPPGIGARTFQREAPALTPPAPTGRPMIEVIKTDEEIAAEAQAADIASRNAAADEAARQAKAAAAADIAFGMAPTRTQVLAKLLQDIMDAIPELSKLTGKTNDCIVLQSAATKVYGALVATPAPTDLPEELKALGWELRRGSHTGRWYAAIKITGEEEEIKTMGRSDISIVVEDCRFMNKSLEIGA